MEQVESQVPWRPHHHQTNMAQAHQDSREEGTTKPILLRSGFRLATLPQRPDWWSAAEMVVLLEGPPITTEELWSSVRVTIRFLVTSLTKAFLSQLLSLAGHPALGRVLVVPNFFHLRMMENTVILGTFNAEKMFWYPSPDLCLDTILSRSSTDNSFDLMAWFFL